MLAFVNLGTWEIVAIVAVALLLFGSRLPSIARSVGKSIVEFKKGVKDVQDGVDEAAKAPPKLEDKQPVTVQKVEEKAKEPVA
ncbi:MAG: twin-arginine translocase TatA/TatE family subunit [Planctomycetes bacterium]|nr:twin-arginine translocase TatA/TatE family subunit [Planctomycetota bacterium]